VAFSSFDGLDVLLDINRFHRFDRQLRSVSTDMSRRVRPMAIAPLPAA
jgi:hypothetical protein